MSYIYQSVFHEKQNAYILYLNIKGLYQLLKANFVMCITKWVVSKNHVQKVLLRHMTIWVTGPQMILLQYTLMNIASLSETCNKHSYYQLRATRVTGWVCLRIMSWWIPVRLRLWVFVSCFIRGKPGPLSQEPCPQCRSWSVYLSSYSIVLYHLFFAHD
jgi:hypothetical protein